MEQESKQPSDPLDEPSAEDNQNQDQEHEEQEAPADETADSISGKMVGVRLADGKVAEFDPDKLDLSIGQTVVVANDRDLNLGQVVYVTTNKRKLALKRVLRRVGTHDLLLIRRNKRREQEAFDFCCKRIEERKLPMKLVSTSFLHGGNKAVFFFTADGRVDFRALVRDLAQQMHVRIEMRQIGVRDEAKLLGGIGICGQPLCCSRYLQKFVPVSIKMAKNQGLALNPQKVSGLCGRLMCCLVYEDDTYKEMRQGFPKIGKTIDTPKGPGKVIETDVMARKLRVLTETGVFVFTTEQLNAEEPEPKPDKPAELRLDDEQQKESQPNAQVQPNQVKQPRDSRRRRRKRKRPSNEAAGPNQQATQEPSQKQQNGQKSSRQATRTTNAGRTASPNKRQNPNQRDKRAPNSTHRRAQATPEGRTGPGGSVTHTSAEQSAKTDPARPSQGPQNGRTDPKRGSENRPGQPNSQNQKASEAKPSAKRRRRNRRRKKPQASTTKPTPNKGQPD